MAIDYQDKLTDLRKRLVDLRDDKLHEISTPRDKQTVIYDSLILITEDLTKLFRELELVNQKVANIPKAIAEQAARRPSTR